MHIRHYQAGTGFGSIVKHDASRADMERRAELRRSQGYSVEWQLGRREFRYFDSDGTECGGEYLQASDE